MRKTKEFIKKSEIAECKLHTKEDQTEPCGTPASKKVSAKVPLLVFTW